MKRFAYSIAISLLLLLSPSLAAAKTQFECGGIDLIAKLERENPKQAKQLHAIAAKLPYANGILWKVEKAGSAPSWIFGTMHLSDPRLLDLPPKADAALREADTLALEITELLDKQEMAKHTMTIMQLTTYLDGSSLDGKLDGEDQALLARQIEEKAGIPWSVARKMRPWALMGMVALPACELARKRAQKPFLDMALGQRAKAAGKTVVGLETLPQQMKVMAALSEPLILKAIIQTARLGPALDDVFETMITRYESGELGIIWTMLQRMGRDGFSEAATDPSYAEFQREVVDKRNIGMANASEALIDKGRAFIAVGALHLPGEKGLLNLLSQRGYTVSAP